MSSCLRRKRVVELIRPRLQDCRAIQGPRQCQARWTEHLAKVELKFDSPVAQIDLTFSLTHDMEVKNLFLIDVCIFFRS